MFDYHLRSGMAHDRADLLAAIALVAMHRTLGAGGLLLAEAATVQPEVDVAHQRLALGAQIAAMLVATVNMQHGGNGLPFTSKPAIGEFAKEGGYAGCGASCDFSLRYFASWIVCRFCVHIHNLNDL